MCVNGVCSRVIITVHQKFLDAVALATVLDNSHKYSFLEFRSVHVLQIKIVTNINIKNRAQIVNQKIGKTVFFYKFIVIFYRNS